MDYKVRFYKSKKFWLAFCDEIPGAMTQGVTLDEARENIKDAIQMMLEPIEPDELKKAERVDEVVSC